MYFTAEKRGDVVTIECAISGKKWRYVDGSKTVRSKAESEAVEWQNTLIETLKNRAALSRKFHTMPEIEKAYEWFRRTASH
jgi:hypothetical protein